VCTITNTRQTGTIEVTTVWSGGTPGEQPTANLNIGTTSAGNEVNQTPVTGLANGSTGAHSVVTGPTYFVSESSVTTGWTPGSAVCTKNATGFAYSPAGGFTVAAGDEVVCTITNTRNAALPQVTTEESPPTAGAPRVAPIVAGVAADVPPIATEDFTTEIVPRPKLRTVSSAQEAVSRGGPSAPRLAISLIVLLVLFAIVFRLPLISLGSNGRWRR
jgi:hypothetical protein